jgi:hypothetical protein
LEAAEAAEADIVRVEVERVRVERVESGKWKVEKVREFVFYKALGLCTESLNGGCGVSD